MKILFVSDTQLGAGADLGNGAEYDDGSRFADQEHGLYLIADLSRDEDVDLIVHLGDIFEKRSPAPHQLLAFQTFLQETTVEAFLLQGNHDVRSLTLPTAAELYRRAGAVVRTPGLLFRRGHGVVFAFLPWAPGANADDLVTIAQELRVRCEEEHPDATPILLAHWAISGSKLPGGAAVEEFLTEAVIPWVALEEMGWALVAAGHIHEPQIIAAGQAVTPMFYAGSPMVCNWGEAESPHGVWVYDTVKPELRFVPIPDRKFVTVDLDIGEHPPEFYSDAVVRVKYATTEDVPVDEGALRERLLAAGARKVLVKGTVERASRARVEIVDEEITPSAALELWMAANEIEDRQAALLREQHNRYLEATP